AVDYMRTASMAVLDYAVKYREELMYNRYQAGRNTIAKYKANPPYAYIVPQNQRDPGTAVEMLRRLAFNGIRVSQLERDVRYENTTYARGTWVIPMDQEFGELARQVLEKQEYPDLREYPGGPPEQPYDAAGWTLPYQMDVKVLEAKSPLSAEFRAALKPLQGKGSDLANADAPFTTNMGAAGIVPPPARITGTGDQLVLDPAQNNSFRVLARAMNDGATASFDNGRYVLSGTGLEKAVAHAEELGLRAERRTATSSGATVRNRVAIYKSFTASMDEGWTEWLLDSWGFKYTILNNSDIQAGDLNSKYDVILFASDRAGSITDGFAKGSVPPRYEGGIGDAGIRALDAFVRAGGSMITFSQSSDFAINAL
ncbi:MAG: hypothetical protein EBS65_25380, partial [Betaproteobacteria bacterium]|nr:hypothetical protein [Betaproteobacteria bacterium]